MISESEYAAWLKPPGTVIDIARTLIDAGFETWCVGGAVRDALLARSNQDWDLATRATPNEVRRLFRHTVPLGIEFGTVGVLDRAGVMHEVTTFRRDVRTDGRHAEVEFGASLDEDLARRDFTINAIAYEPLTKRLHDPYGGRTDLQAGVVRAVGVAADRMTEDRLRALRAIRFASRFGFRIESATWEAIVASAGYLSRLSPERVKQELDKTLEQVANPSSAFFMWQQSGAFQTLIPSLASAPRALLFAVDSIPQPQQFMRAERRQYRRQLRLAALFSAQSAVETNGALRALRASNQETGWVSALAERWHLLGDSVTAAMMTGPLPDDATLRRWAAKIGRMRVSPFMRLADARWNGARMVGEAAPDAARVRAAYKSLFRIAWHDAIAASDLAVDGDDLHAVGIAAGPMLGRILAQLVEDVVDEPSRNSRDWLLNRALDLSAREP